jgi:amidase
MQSMRFEEYRKHDAISLAGLIAKRQVSAEEVLEIAIARAEQVNPAINAIVRKQYEQARKSVAAGLPEGPLKGVPYLLKDVAFFKTGEPVSFGSPDQGFCRRSRHRLRDALQERRTRVRRPQTPTL